MESESRTRKVKEAVSDNIPRYLAADKDLEEQHAQHGGAMLKISTSPVSTQSSISVTQHLTWGTA